APGADASAIALRIEGADEVRLNEQRELALAVGAAKITQKLPKVYQRRDSGEIDAVPADYVMDADGLVRLRLGEYDRKRVLVVDPSIVIAAFMPGTGGDGAVAIAKDPAGFLYMSGYTYSTDFALVGDSFHPFLANNNRDGWVMKLDPNADPTNLI